MSMEIVYIASCLASLCAAVGNSSGRRQPANSEYCRQITLATNKRDRVPGMAQYGLGVPSATGASGGVTVVKLVGPRQR